MIARGLMLVTSCSLLALAGCRGVPVMNVVDAPVAAGRSAQQVEQAILSAGDSLWIENLDRAIRNRLAS